MLIMDKIELPKIDNPLELKESVLEELRRQKLEAISKMYPNKRIIVTKDNQVFIEK